MLAGLTDFAVPLTPTEIPVDVTHILCNHNAITQP